MKKSEAKPGTKVLASTNYDEYGDGEHLGPYVYDEYGDTDLVGVIRSKPARPGYVWVKWIEGDAAGEDDEEVDLKLLVLESQRSQIEADFKRVSKEVKEKMKEAAKIVNEAGKMARSVHSTLANMGASYELVSAMDNNGWRSSSWGC
jgi:hypothetical protein